MSPAKRKDLRLFFSRDELLSATWEDLSRTWYDLEPAHDSRALDRMDS